jgi:adenylate kinase
LGVRLLLIGRPGSGKGTQAEHVSQHFGIAHISSGELLRRHVDEGTAVGRAVAQSLARGDLVPDDIVMDVLRTPIERASRAGGYVLDGYPRTVAQAEAAYLVTKPINASVQVALFLEVPREELVARTLARGRAAGRSDDTLDVVNHRLSLFDELTTPLLDYYARREILLTVDGTGAVRDVTAAVIAELEAVHPRLS